jgi:hypothetical protein
MIATALKARSNLYASPPSACALLTRPNIQHTCSLKPEEFTPISRFSPGEVVQLIHTIETIPPIPPSRTFLVSKYIADCVKLADADRQVVTIHRKHVTHELFSYLWSTANPHPLLVRGHQMQLEWTPATFIHLMGSKPCKVQNCRTGEIFDSTVGEFFGRCGDESEEREVLRLKVISTIVY